MNNNTTVSPIDAVIIIFVIHWIMFIPSYIFQTEKFYDLTGSITYLSSMTYLLMSNSELLESSSPSAYVAYLCVMIWTLRLGIFLFLRVLRDGEDKRFRKILPSFSQLFMTWNLSATWVVIQTLPLMVVLTGGVFESGIWTWVHTLGLTLWLFGFIFQVVADNQKTKFKMNPANEGKFITEGLWSKSRHPNYFGEIVLWAGLTIICISYMSGFQYVALISPVFAFLLIYFVSGVRMLEDKANKKWGKDSEYQKYKKNTPIFVPKL
ncbi:MAG: DUF1295 domain-containing protein [Pseudomonadota bacterium]|nr:DUF1295 domain-containing protein [Pseudomonadota bacterium]